MFRIGEFSKICQISVKSLRYWDEIGLLQPIYLPGERLYRYYSVEQIKTVNRILALQNLGIELEQIKRFLLEHITTEEIHELLRHKSLPLTEPNDPSLQMAAARLQQIEHECDDCDVQLRMIPPQRIIAIREIKPTLSDVIALVKETARHTQGDKHLIAIYHDDSYYQEKLDVQVGFQINGNYRLRIPLSPGREMTIDELPGVETMACTLHQGGWLTLSQGYANLATWIDRNGYRITGVGREVFHRVDCDNGGHATIRELQLPVTRL